MTDRFQARTDRETAAADRLYRALGAKPEECTIHPLRIWPSPNAYTLYCQTGTKNAFAVCDDPWEK